MQGSVEISLHPAIARGYNRGFLHGIGTMKNKDNAKKYEVEVGHLVLVVVAPV